MVSFKKYLLTAGSIKEAMKAIRQVDKTEFKEKRRGIQKRKYGGRVGCFTSRFIPSYSEKVVCSNRVRSSRGAGVQRDRARVESSSRVVGVQGLPE